MASRYRRDIIVASLYHENSNQEPSLYQENVSRKPYVQLAIGEEIEGQLYFLRAMLDSHTLSCGSTRFYRVIIPHDSAWESSVAWTKYKKGEGEVNSCRVFRPRMQFIGIRVVVVASLHDENTTQ